MRRRGGAPKLELFSLRPIDGRENPRLVACWPRRSLASDQRIAYPSDATDMRQLPRNYKLIHIFQHCMLLPCCVYLVHGHCIVALYLPAGRR